jgi:hypothetical protein
MSEKGLKINQYGTNTRFPIMRIRNLLYEFLSFDFWLSVLHLFFTPPLPLIPRLRDTLNAAGKAAAAL